MLRQVHVFQHKAEAVAIFWLTTRDKVSFLRTRLCLIKATKKPTVDCRFEAVPTPAHA